VISVIIPTLNEEESLPRLLDTLRAEKTDHEVIVVDGGSKDRTVEIARAREVRVVFAPPGRGSQLSAGVEVSCGGILFFLHADSTLPVGALDRIDDVLSSDAHVIGGELSTSLRRRHGLQSMAHKRLCLGPPVRALLRRLRNLRPARRLRGARRFSFDPGHGRS
jgi:glycosyltransferase involved in cell wall biosynthesis